MQARFGVWLVALAVVVVPPALAAAGMTGCATSGLLVPPSFTSTECEYTAEGPGAYVAASANPWTIDVFRSDVLVVHTSGGPDNPVGLLETQAGDRVVVTLRCGPPSQVVCAWGVVASFGAGVDVATAV